MQHDATCTSFRNNIIARRSFPQASLNYVFLPWKDSCDGFLHENQQISVLHPRIN